MSTTVELPRTRLSPETSAPEITILIHVTDSMARIPVLVGAYSQVLADLRRSGEMVFILDGVAGELLAQLERIQTERDDVRVLALQGGGHGESIAYKAALPHARGSILVTAWDYLQIDPRELGRLLAAIDAGADLVVSWRWPRVDPLLNRLQSTFFNRFLRWMSRVDLHDLNCNFRVLRRSVLEEVTLYGDLFRFLPIMAARRGFRVAEVKVRHLEERGKTGFFGLGVYVRRLLDILAVTFLTRFTRKPLRFFGIIGLVLVFAGLALALPPFVERLLGIGPIQDRPIVLVGVVLVSFGLQFIGFGLVGEIIIFTQARNLKDYKIERIAGRGLGGPSAAAVSATPSAAAEGELADRLAVRHAAPGEDVVLDRFVEASGTGTVFHLSAWRRMVEEFSGRSVETLVAERRGEVVGLLSWSHWRSLFLGRVSVSVPFAVYGGCVSDDPQAAGALVRRASELADAAGSKYLELRQITGLDPASVGLPLQASDRYVTFRRELPAEPAACLEMLPRKARAEARRGRDAGLRFEQRCDLRLFHDLFAENKRMLGSPAMPLRMLQALESTFGERMVMHQVLLPDGTPIAAVLSFLFREWVLPYYSGGLSGHEKLGVNNFMYWRLMEWASSRGQRGFDFGRSRRDSGPAHFKHNMGFEATPLQYQYHLGPGGKLPSFTPDNPKLSGYKRLWRALPAPITRWVGGAMFRQLP